MNETCSEEKEEAADDVAEERGEAEGDAEDEPGLGDAVEVVVGVDMSDTDVEVQPGIGDEVEEMMAEDVKDTHAEVQRGPEEEEVVVGVDMSSPATGASTKRRAENDAQRRATKRVRAPVRVAYCR